jgi:DNA-binding transcriptional ArsR family regulator
MPAADCTSILKALADRSRLRLVKLLLAEDRSVNDLAGELEISQYNVSKHLRVLKHAGIVDVRAVAQRREYFIARRFRKRLQKDGPVLDCGCCSFDFSKLPD